MCFLEWMGHQWTKAIVLYPKKILIITCTGDNNLMVTCMGDSKERIWLPGGRNSTFARPPTWWLIYQHYDHNHELIVIMNIICLSTHLWLMNIMTIIMIIICLSSHLVSWCHHDHVDKHYWNYYHQDHQKLTTSPNPSKLSPLLHHSTLAAGIACHRNHDHLVIIVIMMIIIIMIIFLIIPSQYKQAPS